METMTIVLLGVAAFLMLAETVLPGGISFCAGLSLMLVALGYEMKWETNFFNLAFIWCMLTLCMSFVSAFILTKFFSSESVQDVVDEDDGMIGATAKVVEKVDHKNCRVLYRGTSWKAVLVKGELKIGDLVTIVAQDDLTLVVEETEENKYNNLKEV